MQMPARREWRWKNLVPQLVVAWMLLVGSVTARAGTVGPPVRLDQLLGPSGGSIQVGNFLFDDFAYAWTGDMPSPDNVNVAPFTDSDDNPGLQITGAFQDVPAGGASSALVTYSVFPFNSFARGARLSGQLTVVGGPGSVLVSETIERLSPGGQIIGELTLFREQPSGAGNSLDEGVFSGWIALKVDTTILSSYTGGAGVATATIVEQTFLGIPAEIFADGFESGNVSAWSP